MELREGRRRAIGMTAEVQTRSGAPGYRARGRVRDVSLSGLYLELPISGLSENSRVRLIVSPEEAPDGRTHVWHCIVMRLDENGAGVMFETEDPTNVDGLLDLMRERLGLSPPRRPFGG
ncbi:MULTISPECIES: PilZ domain-containing protein [unclassified Thioalkalivibrio]|uniref:PilZ domain-containing protein n=1 Tax=unclassified Thioalkalivibrio TaxID=2621013 RepID=UPI00036DBED6|nr:MULTISPECIES: PilZ domain-containing protein [unclassified Thioalkalivibrio]